MGWVAVFKDGHMEREEDMLPHGRPMQAGKDGLLSCIAAEYYGHTVAVDLINAVIAIDYENTLRVQNGTIEIDNPRMFLWVCDETNIGAELEDWQFSYDEVLDENGEQQIGPDGDPVVTKTTLIFPINWRPISFTRLTNQVPAYVVGLQATLPEVYGGKNVKKLVTIFADGRIGID